MCLNFAGYPQFCFADPGSMAAWGLQDFAGREECLSLLTLFTKTQQAVAVQSIEFFMAGEDIAEELNAKWLSRREAVGL